MLPLGMERSVAGAPWKEKVNPIDITKVGTPSKVEHH